MNQQVAPITVGGEHFSKMPDDLYIPPDALRVFLETFQGPLDLLLYLIRKQNIDILDIPVSKITHQYMEYVDLMRELSLELAAEYLVMAAMLAEIKSRLLLPKPSDEQEAEEGDPRAELIRRLQEYERFKHAAENLAELPRLERDLFKAEALLPPLQFEELQPQVAMPDILDALRDVMQRAHLHSDHQVAREVLSIRERMSIIIDKVNQSDQFVEFHEFFTPEEGRMGVVVTFIAILELTRQAVVEIVQSQSFGPIYLKSRVNDEE
ncbi:MAG: segregation/condensation protein A [Gammaproteobacteria bacterium]|nr:segregation/condensation protein A [Gammaproteobacteria bacterium]